MRTRFGKAKSGTRTGGSVRLCRRLYSEAEPVIGL